MTDHAASVAVKPPAPSGAGTWRLQRKCACGTHAPDGGECTSCARERVQRKAASDSSLGAMPASVQRALHSSGMPLESNTRKTMEAGFGHDFSNVRIHSDVAAAESARAINALAYTSGRNVVFANGQYTPGTLHGRRLIAHELAHVVQQQHLDSMPTGIGDAHSSLEYQADRAADRVVSGLPARALPRAHAPLIAREIDTRALPTKDGGTDAVTRNVTPGKCALVPKLRSSTTGNIGGSSAFLQIDLCRGSVAGQIRGELDYGDAIRQAGEAIGKLLANASSGQSSQQALSAFSNDLKQLTPGAQIKMNLLASNVFRLDITGTGTASVAGGAAGKGTVRAEFDTGPVNLVVEGSASGGSNEPTNYVITGNIVVGGKRQEAPDCRVCECSDPKVTFACSHIPGKGKPPDPPKLLPPRFIPYFFEYAKTTPNQRLDKMNQVNLREAVSLIEFNNYSIARIEGSASPEGPARGERGAFKNNTLLAEARATEGKAQLDAAIKLALSSPMVMRTDQLKRALGSGYPVVGRGELFGAGEKGEVADRALMPHLQGALAPPAEGKRDPLAAEHVTGTGLSADVQAETQADVDAFRSGKRGDRKLSQQERLEAVYQPLRRALIVLEPPPPPPPDIRLTKQQIENVIGQPIDCSAEHKALFANVPIAQPFEGECQGSGKPADKPR